MSSLDVSQELSHAMSSKVNSVLVKRHELMIMYNGNLGCSNLMKDGGLNELFSVCLFVCLSITSTSTVIHLSVYLSSACHLPLISDLPMVLLCNTNRTSPDSKVSSLGL